MGSVSIIVDTADTHKELLILSKVQDSILQPVRIVSYSL